MAFTSTATDFQYHHSTSHYNLQYIEQPQQPPESHSTIEWAPFSLEGDFMPGELTLLTPPYTSKSNFNIAIRLLVVGDKKGDLVG